MENTELELEEIKRQEELAEQERLDNLPYIELYAQLYNDGYIYAFASINYKKCTVPFKLNKTDLYEFGNCNGNCYKIEDGFAVKKLDVTEYLAEFRLKQERERLYNLEIEKQDKITELKIKINYLESNPTPSKARSISTINMLEIYKKRLLELQEEIL